MTNIPSFQVRTDSEKHIDFALTHRVRWREGASSAKRFQTELEAVRRKLLLDEQALSRFAGTLARRPETKKRRHDAALRK